LFGDVNGDGTVDKLDLASIHATAGQQIDSSNFRNDLTLDGRINNKDVATCKSLPRRLALKK
jgi:hypothetical protein